jgi:galactose mutarotase-like enzyme
MLNRLLEVCISISPTLHSDSGYTLQSEELEVVVLPDEGGRIASLKSRSSGLEFLTQSHRHGAYPRRGLTTPFLEGPCAGVEECLPTVGACGPETECGALPDHGDFWQLPWCVIDSAKECLTIEAQGFSRPLLFRKTLTVRGNELCVDYAIRNVGDLPTSFLYACHPLFAVQPGDRVVLPDEVSRLKLGYSKHDRLGMFGDDISWPTTAAGISLDQVLTKESGTADMLYTDRLRTGVCSIYRAATHENLEVKFSVETLPYLGVWLCYGGWPDGAAEHYQYAVALEPTTSPCSTLAQAQADGSAITLEAGAACEFSITFAVQSSGEKVR